jgi:hypothetical protein
VTNKTPFLPGLSTKLSGRAKRRQIENLRLLRERAEAASISDVGSLFSEILPPEDLEAAGGDRRKRHFPAVVTFWAWLSQLLEGNGSCGKALTRIQRWCVEAGIPVPKFDTSSYCRARQRLADTFLDKIDALIRAFAEARIEEHHLWRGHRLKAIDGTSVQLMDTAANQGEYPQPTVQKPGCGFPVVGVVGVLDLSLGQLADYVVSPWWRQDANGLNDLCETFQPSDVVIADRAFCSYELIAKLSGRRVDSVMRLHQKRETTLNWRRGRKLGPDSRIVVWNKPPQRGKCGITEEEWEHLPETMEVRLVRFEAPGRDGKMRKIYLATTLLDGERYPSSEIAALYAERWKIEVKFRDIKTTMGMERLEVKSPEMAMKTLRMVRIAYNLVKALQLEAIRGEDIVLDDLSFKATLDAIAEFSPRFTGLLRHPRLLAAKRRELEERILERILLIRPGRSEPRAMKTRPKNYSLLTAPRRDYVEIMHRPSYRAAA